MQNPHDATYMSLVRSALLRGDRRVDRTGVGALSIFGAQCRYDLRDGFPLITVKKTLYASVVAELLWMLHGHTSVRADLDIWTPIWNAWADDDGELGPIYGHQWRRWGAPFYARNQHGGMMCPMGMMFAGIDQIKGAIDLIKTDPASRRIIVSAWNVADVPHMALPPCHMMFQFFVCNDRLDMQLYQRSADIMLGVPFNIASYATLLTMVAQECDLIPGEFIHTMGDAHIYRNHIEAAGKLLERKPFAPPRIEIARKPFFDIWHDDIKLIGYRHHPFMKLEVAV